MAPRETFNGVGVGRKAGSETGEAIRWGHFFGQAAVDRTRRTLLLNAAHRVPISDPWRYTLMKHTRTVTTGYIGVVIGVLTVGALCACGATSSASSTASPGISPMASPTPDVAAARTAAASIIVPIPGSDGVWGGCAQLAGNFAACPFAPVLIARLNDLSSSGYFGDAGPSGVCAEDYLTATQNGLFTAPKVLSATAKADGTVTVVIDRGSPQPALTVTVTQINGAWLATDLASGTGPSASIFSAKPNC